MMNMQPSQASELNSNAAKFLLTIDQSTTATKALLVDESGKIAQQLAISHRQYYPQDGWVEHDPVEIYNNVKAAIRGVIALAGITEQEIAGLTITNQRETALLWDRETGIPVANAIVWQCRRTASQCSELRERGLEEQIQAKTGLLLDPYFSATKWRWLLEYAATDTPVEQLMAGTMDSWIIWNLSGRKVHATDFSNASRTQLFNIETLQWDEELAGWFGVPLQLLPNVYGSDYIYGYVDEPELFARKIPITGVIGDSQGALFGQQCTKPGMAKGTYGTGTSVLMHVGSEIVRARDGLVSAIAWGLGGKVDYALEAIIHCSGDCLNWARDQLGLYRSFEELEESVSKAGDSGGVYLVPAFVGLGAPHWNAQARAAITGLNRSSDRHHILLAALESIAYQVDDAVKLLEQQTGLPLKELRVDGGATANDRLMQFQADLLESRIVCPEAAQLSALGSAYIGGLALGRWSLEEIACFYKRDREFHSNMSKQERERRVSGWQAAVKAVLANEAALHEKEQSHELSL
ncbi:FGGY family carbohydrate kinase [Paenibacillus luteus]|uniref:FGGY family carbohydrate kinase n=1 Tax=Paenibacillus luteus TaxID=2545753 RepID=UPI001F502B67|nr:glycerol kinase GlpK [Paenibacillus luteus]